MPGARDPTAGKLIRIRYRILNFQAPALSVAEMCLHNLGQISEKQQDPFKTLLSQLLDLIFQEWSSVHRHHRLGPVIGNRLHPGATTPGKDHRLPWSVV